MKTLLKLIKNQSFFPLKSQGQSMLPILQENDIVYFKKIPFSKIKVNDLIVFYQKKQIICHRVIYKNKNYLITKGDNTLSNYEKVTSRQVLGKVYQVKRNGAFFNPQTLYLIQSTHYFNEIIKIKNEFNQQKINYLFLKGLPLHLYFEGTHPKRIYADCDVLIEKKDFESAQKILFKFGYKKAELHWSRIIKKTMKEQIEETFFKSINGFRVVFDIHLKLGELAIVHLGYFNNLYSEKNSKNLINYFLINKKQIKINDEKFWILNFEFLILYLALHLFHHNFQGAFRYQFLDLVIKKNKKRLRKILKQVQDEINKYYLSSFVYPVFYFLKKYYQTPLPKDFLTKIKPKSLIFKIYFELYLKKINIFKEETRIKAGVCRFLNLFLLSENSFWQKILVFFTPQVILAIFFVLYHRIKFKIHPPTRRAK